MAIHYKKACVEKVCRVVFSVHMQNQTIRLQKKEHVSKVNKSTSKCHKGWKAGRSLFPGKWDLRKKGIVQGRIVIKHQQQIKTSGLFMQLLHPPGGFKETNYHISYIEERANKISLLSFVHKSIWHCRYWHLVYIITTRYWQNRQIKNALFQVAKCLKFEAVSSSSTLT